MLSLHLLRIHSLTTDLDGSVFVVCSNSGPLLHTEPYLVLGLSPQTDFSLSLTVSDTAVGMVWHQRVLLRDHALQLFPLDF